MHKVPAYLFRKIYSKGRTEKAEGIILRYLQNNKSYCRFGFVISAKDISKATRRNKMKRRAKEIARSIKAEPGYDFIFIIKKEMPFEELTKKIKELLSV